MFFRLINEFSTKYTEIINGAGRSNGGQMPGKVYFLDNHRILSIPEDSTDCRYPYGYNGFNFWAHSSGYMSCNDGRFSVFPKVSEGQEPKIAFFAGKRLSDNKYEVISLLPVPNVGIQNLSPIKYTIFSGACVYYITETSDMRFSVRVFPDKENTLHFTIGIENLSKKSQQLYVSSFLNPFLRHDLFEGFESRWFRVVRLIPPAIGGSDFGSFMIKVNEDLSRTESISNIGAVIRHITTYGESKIKYYEETTSRYEYVGGLMDNLNYPKALFRGALSIKKNPCAFTELGVAGDIIHLDLGADSSIRYDIEFRYKAECVNEEKALFMFKQPINIVASDEILKHLEEEENRGMENLSINFTGKSSGLVQSEILNPFFYHLRKQVKFCSLIKGYVYLSPLSMIGFRDVFQALEALMFWEPAAVKEKMLEALNFVLIDGRCPRQYTLPGKKGGSAYMDLRPFIDQGSWVISTVSTYLKLTGDMGFLNEICGYYQTNEEKDKGSFSGISDSVLDHLIKIMDYLLDKRDFEHTGLIRALYGDWNDALDGLGVSSDAGVDYGTGVSVMATLHVYQNLVEIIDIINKAKKELLLTDYYSTKILQYTEARNVLEKNIHKYAVIEDTSGAKRILHGWGDKRSYLVGSFCDPDGKSRYSLTSNAFWVLSGLHAKSPYMEEEILEAFDMLDSKYGLKTFEPHFDVGTPGVGRIPRLPKGTAENGAVYIHASTFAVMALFKMGFPRDAWNQIFKLLPFTHDKISCSPYIMPNSYGENSELNIDGESMNDWQTGSSNVMFKIFMRFVFGIEPDHDYLVIQPANWCPFQEFIANINIRSFIIKLHYKKTGIGERKFKVNGKIYEGKYSNHLKTNILKMPWHSTKLPIYDIFVED